MKVNKRSTSAILMMLAIVASVDGRCTYDVPVPTRVRSERSRMAAHKFSMLQDHEYQHLFRVTKSVFNYLLSQIEDKLTDRTRTPPYIKLAIFLTHCGHGTSFRVLSTEYGLTIRQLHRILHRVTAALFLHRAIVFSHFFCT